MPRHNGQTALKQTLGERSLIQQIRARQSHKSFAGLALGIGDDCALLEQRPGEQIAVTTDLSIQGRHFQLDWHPPEVVGHRTLARGLSDLAAMGARPLAVFLSLGLPQELTRSNRHQVSWLDRFFDGFFALAKAHKTPLAGGDLSQAPLATADVILVGAVPRGRALLRSGARAGDWLYVTGRLGGAAVGLDKLRELAQENGHRPPSILKSAQSILAPHFHPQPRLGQGLWLQRRGMATSAIDISDGLSTDLTHLCEESGVAVEVDASSLPIATGATLAQALHGGEDYELLFTSSRMARMPRRIEGVEMTRIGRMVPQRRGRSIIALHAEGGVEALDPRGWQHFT
jgi:thiamine-monophosphate kinase